MELKGCGVEKLLDYTLKIVITLLASLSFFTGLWFKFGQQTMYLD
jgi:hypothetical protein